MKKVLLMISILGLLAIVAKCYQGFSPVDTRLFDMICIAEGLN